MRKIKIGLLALLLLPISVPSALAAITNRSFYVSTTASTAAATVAFIDNRTGGDAAAFNATCILVFNDDAVINLAVNVNGGAAVAATDWIIPPKRGMRVPPLDDKIERGRASISIIAASGTPAYRVYASRDNCTGDLSITASDTASQSGNNTWAGNNTFTGTNVYTGTNTFEGANTTVYGKFSVVALAAPGAPTAALVTTASGNLTNGDYTYKVSCVNATGETPIGTASNSITIDATHKRATLSAIPTCGNGATARNLYRVVAGGSTYKLLIALADDTTTTYADNIADASLGATGPTTNTTAQLVAPVLSDTTLGSTCSVGSLALSTTTPNIQGCLTANTWSALGGGGGLTVDTTTISGGADTRVPFQDGTVFSENSGLTFTKIDGTFTAPKLVSSGIASFNGSMFVTATGVVRVPYGLASSSVTPSVTWDMSLTDATMTAESKGHFRTATSSYTWSNAQVVALGAALTGDITVATLPAKTAVVNGWLIITGTAAGTTTLTVSCGRTSASYIDYIVASDAKVAANTVYGDASAERGTNFTGYDLPSYTATVDVKCHFVSTAQNLDQTTGSTGRLILTTTLLP